jgi:RNA polymerase sigma-70 factor (ECF subfamily)
MTPTAQQTRRAKHERYGSTANCPGVRRAPCAAMATSERVLDPQTLGDHLDRLFRAAWALCGSREDAEDLVQETYERVLRRPRLLRRDDDLGYLFRTLRNTYFNARRTASRRPRVVAALDDVFAASTRRDSRPELAAETNLVLETVAALPAARREVLVAVDVVGLSYAEAGRALGVHPNTISSRLARARTQVAKSLS